MGTRINIEFGEKGHVGCVLYCNSHHPFIDCETIVRNVATQAIGYTTMVNTLLGYTYTSDYGGHKEGDRVFWIDTEQGDREKVLRVIMQDATLVVTEEEP